MPVVRLVCEENGQERVFELEDDVVTIGRTSDNHIRIKDALSSRRHCSVTRGDEGYVLEDMGSRNGTFLNGAPVKQQTLTLGDRIEIGDAVIHFGEKLAGDGDDDDAPTPAPGSTRNAAAEKAAEKIAERRASGRQPSSRPKSGVIKKRPSGSQKAANVASAGGPKKKPKLVLRGSEGEVAQKSFEVNKYPFTFGSGDAVSLKLTKGDIKTQHAMLIEDGDEVFLVDLGGDTTIDDKPAVRTRVDHGSVIGMGEARFKVQDRNQMARGSGAVKVASGRKASAEQKAGDAKADSGIRRKDDSGVRAKDDDGDAAEDAQTVVAKRPASGARRKASARSSAKTSAKSAAAGLPGSDDGAEPIVQKLDARVEEKAVKQGQLAQIVSVFALVLFVVLFVVFGLSAFASILKREEVEPNPQGNQVANWSFEEAGAAGGAAVPGWDLGESIASGIDAIEAKGGKRSLRVTVGSGATLVTTAEAIDVLAERTYSLRGFVKTDAGAGAAGVRVLWLDDGGELIETAAPFAVPAGSDRWEEVRATLRPPPGVSKAKIACFAVATGDAQTAWFDRLRFTELDPEASVVLGVDGPERLAIDVAGEGIASILREDRYLVGWVETFEVVAPGAGAGAVRMLGAAEIEARARTGAGRLASARTVERPVANSNGIWFEVRTQARDPEDAGDEVPERRVVGRASDTTEGVRMSWELDGSDPLGVLFVVGPPKLAAPCEVTTADGLTEPLAIGAEPKDGVTEMTWGEGETAVTFRYESPAIVFIRQDSPDRLRVYQIVTPRMPDPNEGALEAGPTVAIAVAKSSTRALARVAGLLGDAAAARADDRLGEARAAFDRILSDPAATADERSEARKAIGEIDAYFAARVAELEKMRRDMDEIRTPRVVDAAQRLLDQMKRQAAPAGALGTAEQLVGEMSGMIGSANTAEQRDRAEKLLAKGKSYQRSRRLALARACFELCLEVAPRDGLVAREAKQKLDFMRSGNGDGGGD